MIVGGYVLHLYCRYLAEEGYDRHSTGQPGQMREIGAKNRAAALREARRLGWRFNRDDVTCPVCVKHGPGREIPHEQDP